MGDPNLTLKFFFIKHQVLKLYIRKMGGFLEEKKLFFFKVKSCIEIYYQVNLYLNLRRFNLVVVVPFLNPGHLSFCQYLHFYRKLEAVVVVIVWQLDSQLTVQSVHIITKVVSLNSIHGEVYSIQHYVINLSVTYDRWVVFSGYSNKTDHHDIN